MRPNPIKEEKKTRTPVSFSDLFMEISNRKQFAFVDPLTAIVELLSSLKTCTHAHTNAPIVA